MIGSSAPRAGAALRLMLALAALLVLAATSGCAGSKGKAAHSGAPTQAGTDVVSGAGAAAATEVTTAYLRFFDPTVAESQKLALIQDGAAFSLAISLQFRSEFAKAVTVQVSRVSVTSANRATVIFTLLLDGKASQRNQRGYAVHQNGKWKVAGVTFCDVLAAQGAPPAVCRTASATRLPG